MLTIKKWLNTQKKRLNGNPVYRLVWSDDEREMRSGTFNDFTESGIFIRSFTGIREASKYSYIKERWILEKWSEPDQSYEPFYVFESGKGEYLQPTLKVVQFLINVSRRDIRDPIMTQQELEDREIKDFEEQLDVSEIQVALAMGSAAGYGRKSPGGNSHNFIENRRKR